MTSDSDGLIFPVGPSSRTNCAHVSFPAGTPVGCDPGAWAQTLVMVQQGVLRLTCHSGREADFPAGAIVYLAGLPLTSIGAAGREPVTLLLLSPRRPPADSDDPQATRNPKDANDGRPERPDALRP
jgi:hypothetical protein